MEELFPLLARQEGPKQYLSLDYSGFSVVAIKAIQEQQEMLEELKSRIEKLENLVRRLQK